jgi:phosphatidylethanolamine-binding protein (PEBP) family uncharacterized protein
MHGYIRLKPAQGGRAWLAGLLLASALAASGCGESTSTDTTAAKAASATGGVSTGTSTTSVPSAQDGQGASTTGLSSSSTGKPSTTHASAVGHSRQRVHLVLPPPGSHPERGLSSAQRANAPVADISLSSPAIKQVGHSSTYTIARASTCQGADRSPVLHWTEVPAGTRELALFAISTTPVNGALYYDWAIAALNPKLTGLASGTLPSGAVLGKNSSGHVAYSICPATGKHETYVFILYALPKSLRPKTGFDPATLRHQAIAIARHSGLLGGSND